MRRGQAHHIKSPSAQHHRLVVIGQTFDDHESRKARSTVAPASTGTSKVQVLSMTVLSGR